MTVGFSCTRCIAYLLAIIRIRDDHDDLPGVGQPHIPEKNGKNAKKNIIQKFEEKSFIHCNKKIKHKTIFKFSKKWVKNWSSFCYQNFATNFVLLLPEHCSKKKMLDEKRRGPDVAVRLQKLQMPFANCSNISHVVEDKMNKTV